MIQKVQVLAAKLWAKEQAISPLTEGTKRSCACAEWALSGLRSGNSCCITGVGTISNVVQMSGCLHSRQPYWTTVRIYIMARTNYPSKEKWVAIFTFFGAIFRRRAEQKRQNVLGTIVREPSISWKVGWAWPQTGFINLFIIFPLCLFIWCLYCRGTQ